MAERLAGAHAAVFLSSIVVTSVLTGGGHFPLPLLAARFVVELLRSGLGWLLDNHLVDEINLLICPVVVGQGTRLFPDSGADTALELLESRATPSVDASHVRITLREQPPPRGAALAAAPRRALRLRGLDPAATEDFLAHFDAYTRRGGG